MICLHGSYNMIVLYPPESGLLDLRTCWADGGIYLLMA